MRMRSHHVAPLFLIPLLTFAAGAQAKQQEEKEDAALESLAVRVAGAIGAVPSDNTEQEVLVWPCSEPVGVPSQFANLFAKEFTAVLFPVLDKVPHFAGRMRVNSSIVESVPSTYALRKESVALDNAASRSQDFLVTGTCELKEHEINVALTVWDVSSRKKLGEATGKIPRTAARRSALSQLLKISKGKQTPVSNQALPRPGRDGVTLPQCLSCPNPAYDTRSLDKTGSVVVRVIVTAEGEADNVILIRSVDPRLDEAAINAILRWKFKPATREGKPIAVWTTIEVNFRHYD